MAHSKAKPGDSGQAYYKDGSNMVYLGYASKVEINPKGETVAWINGIPYEGVYIEGGK